MESNWRKGRPKSEKETPIEQLARRLPTGIGGPRITCVRVSQAAPQEPEVGRSPPTVCEEKWGATGGCKVGRLKKCACQTHRQTDAQADSRPTVAPKDSAAVWAKQRTSREQAEEANSFCSGSFPAGEQCSWRASGQWSAVWSVGQLALFGSIWLHLAAAGGPGKAARGPRAADQWGASWAAGALTWRASCNYALPCWSPVVLRVAGAKQWPFGPFSSRLGTLSYLRNASGALWGSQSASVAVALALQQCVNERRLAASVDERELEADDESAQCAECAPANCARPPNRRFLCVFCASSVPLLCAFCASSVRSKGRTQLLGRRELPAKAVTSAHSCR